MTKNKLKTILLTICCAVLLVCVSVGATVAYLTSTTTEVNNTFTAGNVAITLDEAKVTYNAETNKYEAANGRTNNNEYNILPGTVVWKDPTITVVKNSENCYVRAIVTITYPEGTFDASWLGDPSTGWTLTSKGEATKTNDFILNGDQTVTYVCSQQWEYRYDEIVEKNTADNTVLDPVFTTLTIPEKLDNAQVKLLEKFKIDVVGHAIQAGGFADANDAWTAFGN